MAAPDLSLEHSIPGLVCGVDEAGRGPLAGPVAAGAALLDPAALPDDLRAGVDDSKKLGAAKREALFARLRQAPGVMVTLGVASVEEIDSLNILRATHLAMARAVKALSRRIGAPPAVALIDGNQAPKIFPCPTRCVVGGDGSSLSIAAASIVAKVSRDRMMTALANEHPGYGWERNKGYGSKEHREAIRRLGPTPHHRKSFAAQGELFTR
nr:ribonuclease HII [uncultured Brevundimonas sp.]